MIVVFAAADPHSWPGYLPPVAAILAAALAYGAGLSRLRRLRLATPPRLRHAASYFLGLACLTVAALPPLDRVAAMIFSAHMVQHLLLMVVAAPLLIYGRPLPAFAASLPRPLRRRISRWTRIPAVRRPVDRLFAALPAGILHAGVVWAWHLPGPYQAAVRAAPLHAFEHAGFIGTALLFWALVIPAGRRRAGYLPAALLVLATALQSGALGAILSLSPSPLYSVHAGGAAAWGLTPLEDQQLAGAIMWVPAGGIYLMTMVALLARAFSEMERRDAGRAAALQAGNRR